ncbi:hypothetical protein, partial [uncultured Gammaproteobacteria bacterium]
GCWHCFSYHCRCIFIQTNAKHTRHYWHGFNYIGVVHIFSQTSWL